MSTGTTWALIGGCAAITAMLKATGPLTLGGRELPAWFYSIVALMAPALFAALVVTQVLADGRDLG
ncbi:MAG: AzlD domain-containing protein, partial [Solirubrobacterales bacterium]